MKIGKSIFLALMATIFLMSCGKDDEAKGIAGTWEGYWGFDLETPDVYERWEMESNGEFSAYKLNGTLYATGTWSVDGLEFEAQYTPTGKNYSYSFTGLYADVLDEISGNWGETPSATDGGLFEMHRKN